MSVISTTLRSGPPRLYAPVPAVHLLGNGRYSVWLSEAGMGRSSWCGTALTRWSGERLEDAEGWRFWVRDLELGRAWPLVSPSSARPAGHGNVLAVAGGFGWMQRDHAIESRLEVAVSPLHDAEVRRITLVNRSDRARTLDLTTCAELVLHDPAADASHPAFSKLFVQTALDAASGALVATRRPRGAGEHPPAAALGVLGGGEVTHETDRARFLGRGRSRSRPAALASRHPLSGTVGNVLDPVFAARVAVMLAPGESRSWSFVLAAGADRAAALAALGAVGAPDALDAVFESAASTARQQLETLEVSAEEAESLARLTGALLYGDPALRASEAVLRAAGDDAPVRAALGIPAGAPLIVVRADEPGAAAAWARFRRLLRWWRRHGVAAELVASGGSLPDAGEPGVHVARDLDAAGLRALEASARIVVREDTRAALNGPLVESRPVTPEAEPEPAEPAGRRRPAGRAREELIAENGYGGFTADGREYVIRLDAPRRGLHRSPPLPWVNVIANERFGTLVSESGAGFTWSGNSREHRLTPWANDPLLDPHGEALYVSEPATGAAWSPMPGPLPHPAAYEARHGLGASRFLLDADDLEQETTVSVDATAPVQFVCVRLTNHADRARTLVLYRNVRLVLGSADTAARRVVTDAGDAPGVLFARNATAGPWREAIAFANVLAPADAQVSTTTDRGAFTGRHGSLSRPAALDAAGPLDGATGPMHDPCFAHRVEFVIEPGRTAEVVFLLGEAATAAERDSLLARFASREAVHAAIASARAHWDTLVNKLQVRTPDARLDLMVNAWLPYQTLSCRIHGRSAFYQSGGAFGFRDQLQDAVSLTAIAPQLARAQILRHASHQFVEGDVLHWWHPPLSQGMRTRFADDLLWLPYLTSHYLEATGDTAVLDEVTPYLKARKLEAGEDEAYVRPVLSGEGASVYEHAARAIDRSLRVGAHGLPLFGCGDWNDGMNRVGREGRGESVWMGFFLFAILGDWSRLAEQRDETERASRWRTHREKLRQALEDAAWDGDWYRRGWYDNGAVLGSRESDECQIDALVQAWSVLSGAAAPDRAERAMAAAGARLVSESEQLIRLLTPPFQDTPEDPGYIKGYVAGVRENGGQYTHAALWVVRAFAELGRRDVAARLLAMLSPVAHAADAAAVRRYQVEPYVIAADVYGVAPHVGRGGWTWYTGSSGWMYRVAIESVLGLRLEGGQKLVVRPCIPDDWPGFSAEWELPNGGGTRVKVEVRNPRGASASVVEALYDGRPVRVTRGEARVPVLLDGQPHRLEVTLGPGA